MRRVSMINFGKTKLPEEEQEKPEADRSSGIKFGAKPTQPSKSPFQESMTELEDQRPNKKAAPPIKPEAVKGLFHTEADTVAEKLADIMIQNHPNYVGEIKTIKNLIKELARNDLSVIGNWADSIIEAQRTLMDSTTNRIREFNGFNGTALLEEVLNFGKNGNDQPFLKRFWNGKSDNIETYMSKVAGLKAQVNSVFPTLCSYRDQIKGSKLALHVIILGVVADNCKSNDTLVIDALQNRRVLLNGALTNLQMLSSKLEQTIESVSRMQTEISRIMDVVLPALKMRNS